MHKWDSSGIYPGCWPGRASTTSPDYNKQPDKLMFMKGMEGEP